MEIEDSNKLIAEFIGGIHHPYTEGMFGTYEHYEFPYFMFDEEFIRISDLEYHFNWSWLMPVLEKICRMKTGDGITYIEYAYPRTFGMLSEEDGQIMVRLNGFGLQKADTLIEATYLAIVDFIEYYNEFLKDNASNNQS